MSTRSVLPPQGLFAGLTADQLIAEEQEHQADELPAPSVLGKRTTPSGDVGSDSEGDGDEEPPGRRGGGLPSHSSPGTHPNPATLQMEQTVRRMAKRLKLPNESISLVEQFSQEHSLEARLVLLYGGTVAVWNELSELRRNIGTASYQVGEELEDNIKKYSRLILLSPSIYHYKGKVPKEYLTRIVIKYRFGIPPNIEANGYAWTKITTCIGYELTQARGRLKKCLKDDASSGDAQSQSTIYQLTRAMVGEETYRVSPAVCARVAIMRQIYPKSPNDKFWDEVDETLDSIKQMSEEKRINVLKAILHRDRRTYGVVPGTIAAAPSDDTAVGDEPLIQRRIEDLIEAPGGSTIFQAPQSTLDT